MSSVSTQDPARRARLLEFLTIGWNVGEAVFTITIGIAAGSLALIGFGTDSIVEVFASAVIVWHIGGDDHPERARHALRLVAVAFFVLGFVLALAGIRDLVSGRQADESVLGIAYLALTAVVMFSLALGKRRLATSMKSAPLHSEASLTFLDGILATLTLVGLAMNAWLGWWWADPAAALVVAAAAFNEGRHTLVEAAEVIASAP